MSVLRATLVFLALVYVGLWVLVFNGATGLLEPLVIPLILAVIVALGVALQRFMGLPPRQQHFNDPEDDAQP